MSPTSPEIRGKWGLMGGVFDPVHYGHLALAEGALESFGLDGVLFVVSFNPPHRDQEPSASFDDRLEMVRMAVEDNDRFTVSALEKDLSAPGYTLNIVSRLKKDFPEATWHLILGADNLASFDAWHKPDELAGQVKIVVGDRPGYGRQSEASKWFGRAEKFDIPRLDISSTMIREFIKKNRSIRYLIPEKVRRFITEKGLYR
jgi:nicotinate-nucleotide adenylyltransferase